jgi:hypothetical protein
MIIFRVMNLRMGVVLGSQWWQIRARFKNVLVSHGLNGMTLTEKFVFDFLNVLIAKKLHLLVLNF